MADCLVVSGTIVFVGGVVCVLSSKFEIVWVGCEEVLRGFRLSISTYLKEFTNRRPFHGPPMTIHMLAAVNKVPA